MVKNKKKPTKVTKEELKTIQDYVTAINRTQMDIGGLAFQQQVGVQKINTLQERLSEFNVSLQKKYGKVSVSVNDGTLKEIPDEPVDKKN